jgi:DNA-directed RNA polymerase II subunit RPB3
MSFEEVDLLFKNKVFYKINFVLNEVDLSIANALRRTMSSLLPITTFDDTYYENPENRYINIKTNTSSLHNEFLSHRLSLIPINMNNDTLKIVTKFVQGKRFYEWKNEMKLKFNLEVTAAKTDTNNITKVTSEDFKVINNDDDPSINYFKKDPFTDKFILINKLKYKVGAEEECDKIEIECRPRIGIGKENSRYDPTGTVSFQYTTDNEDEVKKAWEEKKKYIVTQRTKNSNSNDYTEEEYKSFEKSFMLLDKERVYKSNANGEPCSFDFGVESIGFLEPSQIVCSGLKILELRVNDIYNCFENSELIFDDKIQIESIDENNSLKFVIKNEDHTLGTIITYILRKSKQFKFVSYRMNHPTIDEIDIVIAPMEDITNDKIIELFLDQIRNLKNELITLREKFEGIINNMNYLQDGLGLMVDKKNKININDNLIYFEF